jgi:hypothetical protein
MIGKFMKPFTILVNIFKMNLMTLIPKGTIPADRMTLTLKDMVLEPSASRDPFKTELSEDQKAFREGVKKGS